MNNSKFFKFEIACTVIIVLVACVGIVFAVLTRVPKDSGPITTENCAEFVTVECRAWRQSGTFNAPTCEYTITVTPSKYHLLSDVVIEYTLRLKNANFADGTDVMSGTLTIPTIEPGKLCIKQLSAAMPEGDNEYGITMNMLDVEFTVRSVAGTYKYSI